MSPDARLDAFVAAEAQMDPVTDLEAGVATSLLDGTDDVPGQPLGGQLLRHCRVQDHESAAGQHRYRSLIILIGVGNHRLHHVLPLTQGDPARPDSAVGVDGPVAGLAGLDRYLDILP